MTEPKDVSGPISHVTVRVSQIAQPKRTGQTSLLTQAETLLQDHLTQETPEIQDQQSPEATKGEDHVSQQDHPIEALAQDQVLDTVQIHPNVQHVTIAASAPIVQQEISAVTLSADLETLNRAQTRESMTATVTHTVRTEFQETSLATRLLLALATRTQTAKLSSRTRF
jgi:hypothetical protein